MEGTPDFDWSTVNAESEEGPTIVELDVESKPDFDWSLVEAKEQNPKIKSKKSKKKKSTQSKKRSQKSKTLISKTEPTEQTSQLNGIMEDKLVLETVDSYDEDKFIMPDHLRSHHQQQKMVSMSSLVHSEGRLSTATTGEESIVSESGWSDAVSSSDESER